MDKFWKWMEEKGYSVSGKGVDGMLASYNSLTKSYANKSFIDTSKQMLIGYMMEYLIETEKLDSTYHSIEEIYNDGVKIIEKYKNKGE